MKRYAYWITINGLLAAALYFGMVEQVKGAQNIVVFYSWFIFLVAVLSLAPPVWKALAAKPESLPPQGWRVFDISCDVGVVIILVWVGWMWTAGAYLAHIVFLQAAISAAKQHVFDTLKQES